MIHDVVSRPASCATIAVFMYVDIGERVKAYCSIEYCQRTESEKNKCKM